MAEEIGSAVGSAGAKAALKSFMSPSIDIVKTILQGIIELVLRGANVVLALISLISAAACQGSLRVFISIPQVERTNATAGWIIFLSFWVMVYQIIAIVQLFLKIKIVYTVVPIINWSLFFLVDIIAIGIAAGGYFCGAIPMAVYAGEWSNVITIGVDQSAADRVSSAADRVSSAAGATSAFSFFILVLSIGMIVYFFIARYVLKWSTHGEQAPKEQASSAGGNYTVDDQ